MSQNVFVSQNDNSLCADVSICARQGRRQTMEDTHIIKVKFEKDDVSHALLAVFDGHGGIHTAKELQTRFANALSQQLVHCAEWQRLSASDKKQKYYDALKAAFKTCSDHLQGNRLHQRCGSTAAVALVVGQDQIYVANCGDSEIVRFRAQRLHRNSILSDDYTTNFEFETLTHAHRPSDPDEKKRIESMGGFVTEWGEVARVNGILAVSRSFGDFAFAERDEEGVLQFLISSEPFVAGPFEFKKDDHLVIACDGLWDVVEKGQVGEMIHEYREKEVKGELESDSDINSEIFCSAAQMLTKKAISKFQSTDNVTTIVVRNKGCDKLEKKSVVLIDCDNTDTSESANEENEIESSLSSRSGSESPKKVSLHATACSASDSEGYFTKTQDAKRIGKPIPFRLDALKGDGCTNSEDTTDDHSEEHHSEEQSKSPANSPAKKSRIDDFDYSL